MDQDNSLTGAEAGLSGDDQIKIALREILDRGGIAQMDQIYSAVEKQMDGALLSKQGKASLRYFVNSVAVRADYIYPYDESQPGWKITPEGRDFLEADRAPIEEVIDVDTNQAETIPSNSARGDAFELYILALLKKIYPGHAWYRQGAYKKNERGLDLIGSFVGNNAENPQVIGVQVKFHRPKNAPTEKEWLKFMAGCFARRVDHAMFITTGSLTGEQRREAGEAKIVVIEGRDEVERIASLHGLAAIGLSDNDSGTLV